MKKNSEGRSAKAAARKPINQNVLRLVISALMIGLGSALSLVSIGLPFGGSVTLACTAPLVVLSQLYGFGWGLVCCSVFGALQLILGLGNFSYATSLLSVVIIALFDYIVAYGSMALSGLTRNMKLPVWRAVLGSLLGCAARFVCHFITGATVWSEWADVAALPTFLQTTGLASEKALIYSYSFFYNAGYMLPEAIITAIVSAAVLTIIEGNRSRLGIS